MTGLPLSTSINAKKLNSNKQVQKYKNTVQHTEKPEQTFWSIQYFNRNNVLQQIKCRIPLFYTVGI